jgi:predicted phosphodiesterase
MRIGIMGDVHMHTKWTIQQIYDAKEQGADVIIQLGDFGYLFFSEFKNSVQEALSATNLNLYFIDGNHENFEYLYSLPIQDNGLREVRQNIVHIPRGFRWEWEGIKCLGLGGAYSVDSPKRQIGVSWWPQETITLQDAENAVNGGKVDVMFTHDAPYGIDLPNTEWAIETFGEYQLKISEGNSKLLLEVVNEVKPDVLWHGHHHMRYDQVLYTQGHKVSVRGLDCNGFPGNMVVVDAADLASPLDDQKHTISTI